MKLLIFAHMLYRCFDFSSSVSSVGALNLETAAFWHQNLPAVGRETVRYSLYHTYFSCFVLFTDVCWKSFVFCHIYFPEVLGNEYKLDTSSIYNRINVQLWYMLSTFWDFIVGANLCTILIFATCSIIYLVIFELPV